MSLQAEYLGNGFWIIKNSKNIQLSSERHFISAVRFHDFLIAYASCLNTPIKIEYTDKDYKEFMQYLNAQKNKRLVYGG